MGTGCGAGSRGGSRGTTTAGCAITIRCTDRSTPSSHGDIEIDIVEQLFNPLPSFVVAHYLGVPAADRSIERIVALAYGAHHCLGAAAARLTGAVALERLLARFPRFEVDGARGRYAPGPFVRRFESLPCRVAP